MIEHEFTCPYCFTNVSILIDVGATNQKFIEDCERCCNPIEFTVKIEGNQVVEFDYQPIGQ